VTKLSPNHILRSRESQTSTYDKLSEGREDTALKWLLPILKVGALDWSIWVGRADDDVSGTFTSEKGDVVKAPLTNDPFAAQREQEEIPDEHTDEWGTSSFPFLST